MKRISLIISLIFIVAFAKESLPANLLQQPNLSRQ